MPRIVLNKVASALSTILFLATTIIPIWLDDSVMLEAVNVCRRRGIASNNTCVFPMQSCMSPICNDPSAPYRWLRCAFRCTELRVVDVLKQASMHKEGISEMHRLCGIDDSADATAYHTIDAARQSCRIQPEPVTGELFSS